MKMKPRNAKVSGLPTPRLLRSTAAQRPNSIKRKRCDRPRALRLGYEPRLKREGIQNWRMPPTAAGMSRHGARLREDGAGPRGEEAITGLPSSATQLERIGSSRTCSATFGESNFDQAITRSFMTV